MRRNRVSLFLKALGIALLSLFAVCIFEGGAAEARSSVYGTMAVKQGNGKINKVNVWPVPKTAPNIYADTYQKWASR